MRLRDIRTSWGWKVYIEPRNNFLHKSKAVNSHGRPTVTTVVGVYAQQSFCLPRTPLVLSQTLSDGKGIAAPSQEPH